MAFISVTRLRLRSIWFVPAFCLQTMGTLRQVKTASGFHGGSLLADRAWTFWTLTMWDSRESMRTYMTTGSHRTAMPFLLKWCDEASVAHWDQDAVALPSWAEADRRMRAEGRPSKVRHPSGAHAAMAFRTPRLSGAAPILPKRGTETISPPDNANWNRTGSS